MNGKPLQQTSFGRECNLRWEGPGWRWKQARQTVDWREPFKYSSRDPLVQKIIRYLLGDPAADFSPIERIAASDDLRLEIDARCLAGQSVEETASAVGLAADLVDLYEQCHFAVRESLQHRQFIIDCAIINPNVGDHRRTAVLLDSFRGGLVVAEHWLAHLPYLDEHHDVSTPEGLERERLSVLLLLRRLSQSRDRTRLDQYKHLVELRDHACSPMPRMTVSEVMRDRVNHALSRIAADRQPSRTATSSSPCSRVVA